MTWEDDRGVVCVTAESGDHEVVTRRGRKDIVFSKSFLA